MEFTLSEGLPREEITGGAEPWWRIGSAFVAGALLEVTTHPKPGLVTSRSNGSHDDMSLRTFMVSTAAIAPCLFLCAEAGWSHAGPPAALLPAVRRIGREHEESLLRATGGVNTQRGFLFSAGVLSAAAGMLVRVGAPLTPGLLFSRCALMTAGLCDRELAAAATDDLPQTAGIQLFRDLGIRGIRGEVEDGFPTVLKAGLPALAEARAAGAPMDRALVHILINLIAVTEDTTVLWRGGRVAQEWLRYRARAVLDLGGALDTKGLEAIHQLDVDCIDRGLSPGGSADLLAVTVGVQALVEGSLAFLGADSPRRGTSLHPSFS